jgi:hypothetical protein
MIDMDIEDGEYDEYQPETFQAESEHSSREYDDHSLSRHPEPVPAPSTQYAYSQSSRPSRKREAVQEYNDDDDDEWRICKVCNVTFAEEKVRFRKIF